MPLFLLPFSISLLFSFSSLLFQTTLHPKPFFCSNIVLSHNSPQIVSPGKDSFWSFSASFHSHSSLDVDTCVQITSPPYRCWFLCTCVLPLSASTPQPPLSPKRPPLKLGYPFVPSAVKFQRWPSLFQHYPLLSDPALHLGSSNPSAFALNLLCFPPTNSFADALSLLWFLPLFFPLQVLYWHWLNCNNCSSKSRLTTATTSLFSLFSIHPFHAALSTVGFWPTSEAS